MSNLNGSHFGNTHGFRLDLGDCQECGKWFATVFQIYECSLCGKRTCSDCHGGIPVCATCLEKRRKIVRDVPDSMLGQASCSECAQQYLDTCPECGARRPLPDWYLPPPFPRDEANYKGHDAWHDDSDEDHDHE